METTSYYAYIIFKSLNINTDFPTEVITNKLGIEPTSTMRKGESINKIHKQSFTYWEYQTDTFATWDINDALKSILIIFDDKVDVINDLRNLLNVYVHIQIVTTIINGETPTLGISSNFVTFASAINASIDIDMFIDPFTILEENI